MSLVTSRIFFQANVLRYASNQWIPRAVCRINTSIFGENGILDHRQTRGFLVGRFPLKISSFARSIQYSSLKCTKQTEDAKTKDNKDDPSTYTAPITPPSITGEQPKQSIIQKFKQMYKQYWYVLIPVHCFTSVFWAGGFYFAVKNGLDVIAVLESLGVSEKIIEPLRHSSAGYYALAYAMYKVATPARYAVTVGGTTLSINYLTKWGYIKPMPSKEQLQVMYEAKKVTFNKKRDELRKKVRLHKAELLRKKMRFAKKRAKKP